MGALHAIHAVADVERPAYDAEPEKREIGFGIVDPQVRALKNGYATAVYEVLAAHANPSGVCWPPLSTICEAVGWSKPTVIKAMKALTDAGLVTVEQQRRRGCIVGNRYTLPFRNRTKSTTLNQSPSIMTGRVNDVDLVGQSRVNDIDSTSKGDLPSESTTFTQTGKGRLHKQDVVKQDSHKQENEPSTTADDSSSRPPTTSMPYLLLEAILDEQGFPVADLSQAEKGKQLAATKRIAAAGLTEANVRAIVRWLRGYMSGVDAFDVERSIPKWRIAGMPSEPSSAKPKKPLAYNDPRNANGFVG
jgi:DNA-binding transcriptional ArsR family regulator